MFSILEVVRPQALPSFCLFSFFLQLKHSTNLTKNEKSVDGLIGTRTRGSRMEGADENHWAMAARVIGTNVHFAGTRAAYTCQIM